MTPNCMISYRFMGHLLVGAKTVKKKWRWQWKKKELPPVPSPQFAHTPPGHTCSLPCCNHDQDDLEVTKPVSHSQRGCVPVPLVNGPDFSNNNFFMKKIAGLCDEPFADGWESRSLSDSQSEGRNILRLKKHAKAASPKHGAVTLTTLRRRKQLAPWEQIRSRQIALPGSLKPHRVTFLNFQPGESSDSQEVIPSSDKSSFSSAVAFIQNSKKDEHSQQTTSLQTFVPKTAKEIHENSTSSSSEAGADLGGKRRLNSQLPPVPSVENNSAEVDSLGDVRSLFDEHLYDVPSDLMYSQESEKVTKALSVSLPHIPSIPLNDGLDGNMADIDNNSFHGSTSDSVNINGSVNDSSNYHGSISDSANYHGSVSGSHTSSYVYNGSLVSHESCDPLYNFRKSNYFPPIRRPKRIPVLMDKNVDTLGHRDGNMLLYTDKSYSHHDIRQSDQHVSGHVLNRQNKIKLWDLKSMSVNSEPNIYSTFPLRRPVTALWTTGQFNQRSRHRHYSDVSSNQISQMFKTSERGQYLDDHSITMNDLCPVTSSNLEDLPNMTVFFRPANKSNTISDFSQRHGHTQHLDLSDLKLCLNQVSSESPKVQGIGSTLRTNTVDRSTTKSWSFPGNEAQRFLWTQNNIVNWRLQAEHFKDTNFITLIL